MTITLGIDIAKDKFDAAIVKRGQPAHHRTFANTPHGFEDLKRWLSKQGAKGVHVCMEATGYYYLDVADALVKAKFPVSVVNPYQIKAYGDSQLQRNKTDRLDAALLADYCATQQPPLWNAPSAAMRELLALIRRYDDLIDDRQRERNRRAAAIPSKIVNHDIDTHITFLDPQLAALERQINDFTDSHPDLKRERDLLDSIPGIGKLTATRLLAELQDWQRFDNVRQVVAFVGLNPRQHTSGKRQTGHTPISKRGNSNLRAGLYMPALSAIRHNPILRAFADRLKANGLKGKAVVVAVMRKLLHLVYGILKSGRPFDPAFNSLPIVSDVPSWPSTQDLQIDLQFRRGANNCAPTEPLFL